MAEFSPSIHPCLRLPLGVNSLEYRDEIWRQKTRIVGVPDGEEITTLAFFVLTQYRLVTDRQTDGQTSCSCKDPRSHSVARIKTTICKAPSRHTILLSADVKLIVTRCNMRTVRTIRTKEQRMSSQPSVRSDGNVKVRRDGQEIKPAD